MKTWGALFFIFVTGVFFRVAAQNITWSGVEVPKEDKQFEKLQKKHRWWKDCIIVRTQGDTLLVRIEDKQDYSITPASVIPLSDNEHLRIAYKDEREEKIGLADIAELHVPSLPDGYRDYLGLGTKAGYDTPRNLMRLVLAGKCMVLSSSYTGSEMTGQGQANYQVDEYVIYYQGKFTKVKVGLNHSVPLHFRKTCGDVLPGCPSLTKQVADKTFRSNDLLDIVAEFNKCIGEGSSLLK
jgi:hypothetical protein